MSTPGKPMVIQIKLKTKVNCMLPINNNISNGDKTTRQTMYTPISLSMTIYNVSTG